MTLRVCIATPALVGATETFIQAHLVALPHDIEHIYGNRHSWEWDGQKLADWHKQNIGAPHSWLNILPRYVEFRVRRQFFPQPSATDILRDFLAHENVDVVLAEYGTVAANIAPACMAAGVPLVAHFHGFDASHDQTLAEFAESYRAMFDFASAVISVSAAMSVQLQRLGCVDDKIYLNPYGPDDDYFDVQPDYSSNTLLSVGRHTYKKAPYLVLDAFRRASQTCPDLRLCMIGDGELWEISKRLTVAWGLEDKVEFVGLANKEVIIQRMSSALAFVQHSLQALNGDSEGMPVAILEAGAAGLPVISTEHAGIPDAVIHGVTGFIVEPGNARAMASCIETLARDRGLAQCLGSEAKTHISRNYSLSRHLSMLDEILLKARDGCAG